LGLPAVSFDVSGLLACASAHVISRRPARVLFAERSEEDTPPGGSWHPVAESLGLALEEDEYDGSRLVPSRARSRTGALVM
jgi:hypothetical protein